MKMRQNLSTQVFAKYKAKVKEDLNLSMALLHFFVSCLDFLKFFFNFSWFSLGT